VLILKAAKYILLFVLTTSITLPDAIMHQVLRLPALAAHYYHHLTEHQSIGVIAFIELHYGNTEHMQTDAHEHENLPGTQKQQHCQHAQVIPVAVTTFGIHIQHPEFNAKAELFTVINEHVPSNNAASIWQPPKLA
jgi:hypothetical protein